MNFVVNKNSWTLKFDNFFDFQNDISNNPLLESVIMMHCVRKSICSSPLTTIQHIRSKSALNYVPRAPSCHTCLTCLTCLCALRAHVFYVPACPRAFVLDAPSFFYVPYVPSYFYVPYVSFYILFMYVLIKLTQINELTYDFSSLLSINIYQAFSLL